jgi:aspartate aminotransferase
MESQIVKKLPKSATIEMSKMTVELKKQGLDIIDFGIGEPAFETPLYIQEQAKNAIDSQNYFKYPPVAGYDDLREGIAYKLNFENKIKADASQVLVTAGSKQAIYNTLLAVVNPGDEVIIFSPHWGSYADMAILANAVPIMLKADIENQFKPSKEELAAKITKKTKAILFSSPCNPTGSVFSEAELKDIASVMEKHKDILIISDEIYEHINFSGKHISIGSFENVREQTVTINGFSKAYCMTGWRVGYLHSPQSWLIKACEKIQSQTTSSICSIAQRAAFAALQLDKAILQDLTSKYANKLDLAMSLLCDIENLKISKPQGAFYIFPDISHFIKKDIKNANELCKHLLTEAHVATVSGAAFGSPNNIRISYATSEQNIITGIERLKKALNALA